MTIKRPYMRIGIWQK